MTDKKRNTLILGGLGSLAILLLILSFSFNTKEAAVDVDQVEEAPVEDVTEDEPVEEPTVNETDESNMTTDEIAKKRYKEETDSKTWEITNKKYVSKFYGISFEVPSSWIGKVSVVEQDMKIGFLYKEEHEFLSMIFVSSGKYAHDSDYYDSLYRKILDINLRHLMYAPASQHPLYDQEGSEDYKELSSFVGDVDSVVETVKVIKE